MSGKGKNAKICYVYALYGGCMKQGFVRYGATDNESPEDEFEKFKDVYGRDVKARYIKVSGQSTDALKRVINHLQTRDGIHDHGLLYELNISRAVTEMKTACNVKKAHTWGLDENHEDDNPDDETPVTVHVEDKTKKAAAEVSKPVKKTVVKGTVAKEIDIEEDMDEAIGDAEDEEGDTHAKTTKNTTTSKVAAKAPAAKAPTNTPTPVAKKLAPKK